MRKCIIISVAFVLGVLLVRPPIVFANNSIEEGTVITKSVTMTVNQRMKICDMKDISHMSSSNNRVVHIKGNTGIIKAKKVGTSTIITIDKSTYQKTVYKVNVLKKIRKIKLSVPYKTTWVGNTVKIKSRCYPSKKTEQLKWKSSNRRIATVNNGYVKFNSAGKVRITAYSKGAKKSIVFKVRQLPKIKNGNYISREVGSHISLSFDYRGKKPQKITYSSNNIRVATVTNKGVVYLTNPGEADITIKAKYGMKLTCHVTSLCEDGYITYNYLKTKGVGECKNLAIVAHPDDETLWGGGSLLSKDWFIVCLTNGNTSHRAAEFRNVLNVSGNKGVILSYPDDSYKGIRDDWSKYRNGISKDLETIIRSKDWNRIVTYNPEGVTGHIHHKLTQQIVYEICSEVSCIDRLWYYGTFYKIVPEGIPRISNEALAFKEKLVNIYCNEKSAIDKYWRQMLPYEDWKLAVEWGSKGEAENNQNEPSAEDEIESNVVSKQLSVVISTKGEPKDGYRLEKISGSYDVISVYGSAESISRLSEDKLFCEVDIHDLDSNKEFEIELKELLPEDISIVENTPFFVNVNIIKDEL